MTYSAGDTLVRAVMTAQSGLVRDEIVNDFAFTCLTGAPTGTDLTNLFNVVNGFYRDTQSNGHAVGEYISNIVNRSATHLLEAYKIQVPPMGSPIATTSWLGPVTAAATSGNPAECAAVLSYTADLTGVLEESGATRPRARRRGRLYIGPLINAAIQTTTPPYMLETDFLQTLRQAATAMYAAADGQNWRWSVWSRKDQLLRGVVGGWTDNAPDTQRRRGPDATTRVAWTI